MAVARLAAYGVSARAEESHWARSTAPAPSTMREACAAGGMLAQRRWRAGDGEASLRWWSRGASRRPGRATMWPNGGGEAEVEERWRRGTAA